MLIGDIISAIESKAPTPLQEDYDNSGLQVGSRASECTGVLLCVDVTPAIVDEAISLGYNLIISHHPLIFHGLKRLTGSSAIEASVMNAIAAGISIYSSHTSMDNAAGGVSHEMARKLGLSSWRVLEPMEGRLLKLTTFVPHDHLERVRLALFDAGAGRMGNYDSCSFTAQGNGSYRPLQGSKPFIGAEYEFHIEPETRLEVMLPAWLKHKVEEALLLTHPYEVPAYEFVRIDNAIPTLGSGIIGKLPVALKRNELAAKVKEAFGSPITRCSDYPADIPISRVAVCGGSGSFLLKQAIHSGAQAFITSDTKYHDFVDYASRILIVDIGHFESEQCSKDIFYRTITEIFPNFAVRYSKAESNPIIYL